jgi:hypothetical protein
LREAPVVAGRTLGELVAVDGLEPGQQVVLAPGERVMDGVAVKVAKK